MTRFPAILLLATALAVAGCSSSSSPTAAPSEAASAESATAAPASAAPVESAATSAAPSAAASVDMSAFGSQYAQIQADLQKELATVTAGMATATTPAQIAALYGKFADVWKKSIAAQRAIAWPAGISSDMDKLLADEDELASIFGKMTTDPTSSADQARLATIQAELPALTQRIAAFFGVSVTP